MKLTNQAIDLMRTQIAKGPFGENEMRRVEGMGGLFMSPKFYQPDEDGEIKLAGMVYWKQYSFEIDGVKYYFYGGMAEHAPQQNS